MIHLLVSIDEISIIVALPYGNFVSLLEQMVWLKVTIVVNFFSDLVNNLYAID